MTCEEGHTLKLSTVDNVLPNIHICTQCDLILVPVNLTIEALKNIKEELLGMIKDIDSGVNDVKEFVKDNKSIDWTKKP